jgi:hypothetical protein
VICVRAASRDPWPGGWPRCWRRMELRRHRRCGELLAHDPFCGEWFHPAYHAESGFAARSSGYGARCPRCGREVHLDDTEPVSDEAQPALFD